MDRHRSAWLGVLILTPFLSPAQQPMAVSDNTFNEHVIERTEPVYPPIAEAARMVGKVVIEVQVGADGKIISTKAVSGPPMLLQAALDCVRKWSLKPFEKDGTPIAVTGQTSIVFDLGKDDPSVQEEKVAERYFHLSDDCHAKSGGNAKWEDAAPACLRAAQTAEQFPPDQRFIEKRSAYVYAAYALMMNGDLKVASKYADLAVETVKLGHDDNSGENAAYSVRGFVEAKSGDFVVADQDFTTAEEFERKAIELAKSEKFEHLSYTASLIRVLRIHAQLLEAMGRPDEAQRKLEEAAAVK